MVRDISGVDRVAIASGTGVEPNVCSLLRSKLVENLVI